MKNLTIEQYKQALLLSGKVVVKAEHIINGKSKNLSNDILLLEKIVNKYDNFIFDIGNIHINRPLCVYSEKEINDIIINVNSMLKNIKIICDNNNIINNERIDRIKQLHDIIIKKLKIE